MNCIIKNRLHCEADDLIRLFKSGQSYQLDRTAQILVKRINELYSSVEERYEKDNLGIAEMLGWMMKLHVYHENAIMLLAEGLTEK